MQISFAPDGAKIGQSIKYVNMRARGIAIVHQTDAWLNFVDGRTNHEIGTIKRMAVERNKLAIMLSRIPKIFQYFFFIGAGDILNFFVRCRLLVQLYFSAGRGIIMRLKIYRPFFRIRIQYTHGDNAAGERREPKFIPDIFSFLLIFSEFQKMILGYFVQRIKFHSYSLNVEY